MFQGGIGARGSSERQGVYQALRSARSFYPGSEVILATWRGMVDEEFPGIRVIECEDPGPIQCAGNEIINLNRQIVSSRCGLQAATRPYAVKLRTDMVLTHGHMFEAFAKVGPSLSKVSRERIVVLNLTGRRATGPAPYPFMVCDWLYAGLRQDVLELFDLANYPEEYIHWFSPSTKPGNDPYNTAMCRYYAETYIWYHYVNRQMGLDLQHSSDNRPHLVAASEEVMAKNLIVLNPGQAGIASWKHKIPFDYHYTNYTHLDWLRLLERWEIAHRFQRPLLDWEKLAAYYRGWFVPATGRWYRDWIGSHLARLRRFLAPAPFKPGSSGRDS